MFGVEFSQTYHEPVPGTRCTSKGSNPPVGLHVGTSSAPLHIQRAHNSPPETTPTQGWPVAFGGVSEGASWMPASHSEVRVVQPLTSTPQPSNSWRGRMARPCPSLFPPSFLIYLYQWTSGKPNCCYFHLEQANRYRGRKSFFFSFSLNLPPK